MKLGAGRRAVRQRPPGPGPGARAAGGEVRGRHGRGRRVLCRVPARSGWTRSRRWRHWPAAAGWRRARWAWSAPARRSDRALPPCGRHRRAARPSGPLAGASEPWRPPVTAFLDRLFSLEGRVALVTGGSSGIGQGIAGALAAAGAAVVLLARGRGGARGHRRLAAGRRRPGGVGQRRPRRPGRRASGPPRRPPSRSASPTSWSTRPGSTSGRRWPR